MDLLESVMLLPTGANKTNINSFDLTGYINDINQQYTQVLMEYGKNGKYNSIYSYGLQRLGADYNGAQTTYLYDGRGSMVNETNGSDTSMSAYLYDEWGSLISGKVHTNGFYSDNYLYNGEAMDITTELYYLRARYYDPSQGRFMQQDTFLGYIKTPISQNLYIYCYNSPLNYIDPSGHTPNGESYFNWWDQVFLSDEEKKDRLQKEINDSMYAYRFSQEDGTSGSLRLKVYKLELELQDLCGIKSFDSGLDDPLNQNGQVEVEFNMPAEYWKTMNEDIKYDLMDFIPSDSWSNTTWAAFDEVRSQLDIIMTERVYDYRRPTYLDSLGYQKYEEANDAALLAGITDLVSIGVDLAYSYYTFDDTVSYSTEFKILEIAFEYRMDKEYYEGHPGSPEAPSASDFPLISIPNNYAKDNLERAIGISDTTFISPFNYLLLNPSPMEYYNNRIDDKIEMFEEMKAEKVSVKNIKTSELDNYYNFILDYLGFVKGMNLLPGEAKEQYEEYIKPSRYSISIRY